MEKKDNKQIQGLVHSVKGSGGNIGLKTIYDQAYSIEQNYSTAGVIDTNALNALAKSVERSLKDIAALVFCNQENSQVEAKKVRDFSEVSQSIYDLLIKSEFISHTLIDELTASSIIAEKVDESQKIIEALDLFEYELALKYLTELK